MFDVSSNRRKAGRRFGAVMPVLPQLSTSEDRGRPVMTSASFFRRSPLVLLAVALVAMAVVFAHDTPPAEAQSTEVWTGTLTALRMHSGLLGCSNDYPVNDNRFAHKRCDNTETLSNNTFTHDGVDYTIEGITQSSSPQSLSIRTKPSLPSDLALVVGDGTWMSVRDARYPRTKAKIWYKTDFSWMAGDEVSLKLVAPDSSTPTVSLSASPNPVLEGNPVTVTATLSSALSSAVVIPVYLDNQSAEPADHGKLASITIPANSTTGTAVITTAEDGNACTSQGRDAADGCEDEVFSVGLRPGLPVGVLSEVTNVPAHSVSSKLVKINIIDDDVPLPTASLSVSPGSVVTEGNDATVIVKLSRLVYGEVSIPLTYTPDTAESNDYSGPAKVIISPRRGIGTGVITIPEDGDTDEWEAFTVSLGALPNWLRAGSPSSYRVSIKNDTASGTQQSGGQGVSGSGGSCDTCGTEGDTGAVAQSPYAELVAQMYEWRNDPKWKDKKAHTDRWDRALLSFGETVDDTSLTQMMAHEAQGYADRGWTRWVEVAKALKVLQNQAPTVSASIADVTIVNESGTSQVSLSGVFEDADGDALTITAASSDESVGTVSVASDYFTLMVTAQARGSATVTVTADDGNGGTVEDSFTVTVKAAPVVSSTLADVTGLEMEMMREVSLSGVFSDADGDALTITAVSSDEAKATVSVAADGSALTLTGVAEGTATITVTAQDSDGNRVRDAFEVEVMKRFASLIPKMYQWRNDPKWKDFKEHTDRWDRALLAFGETVADTTLTRMTADEAQGYADKGSAWSRWVPVAAALREMEGD